MRSSLGSGHASLNLIVSEISTLRKRLKDSIATQRAGNDSLFDRIIPWFYMYNLQYVIT